MISIAKPNFGKEEEQAVLEVLRSGRLAQGPKVEEFERKFAEFINVKHAIAVSSGTAALEIAIKAFDFPENSEIITTPFSFVSTANSVVVNGLKPVFVDVDEKTFNINADLIEKAINERTVAILPVHLYGQCADMSKINKIAAKHNLKVIEDAAQSHGAEHYEKKAGTLGDIACFSFYATKNMAIGEGGMITTSNDILAERCRLLRTHGQYEKYKTNLFGTNARMTEMQAAIGIEQLKKLPEMNDQRIQIAKRYDMILKNKFKIPYVEPFNKSVYHQYTLKCENRDDIIRKLIEKEIAYGVYYPIPIHLQTPYMKKFGYQLGNFPIAEKLSEQVLSLPIYATLTNEEVSKVISALE